MKAGLGAVDQNHRSRPWFSRPSVSQSIAYLPEVCVLLPRQLQLGIVQPRPPCQLLHGMVHGRPVNSSGGGNVLGALEPPLNLQARHPRLDKGRDLPLGRKGASQASVSLRFCPNPIGSGGGTDPQPSLIPARLRHTRRPRLRVPEMIWCHPVPNPSILTAIGAELNQGCCNCPGTSTPWG